MNIIIMGPPGSGKGTQAKMVSEKYNIPSISSGEIFRREMDQQTELGKKIKNVMNAGQLVPDDITIEVVKKRLAEDDCKNGWILDGFPRTLPQAKALDKFAKINFVISLKVPDEVTVERIKSRAECVKCGAIFGLTQGLPQKCAVCNGELRQRNADPEVIKKRLEWHHKQTEPIIEYYQPRNIVYEVDGNKSVDDVFNEFQKIVG